MTHIIIKTSKAKVLHHRDQLVAEATAKKELVGYSDDYVETADGKYIFRVMPVAMPMEVLNQIYDLGNIEGDADVSDVVRSLEADIAKIHEAIAAVVKSKPSTAAELPTFTGNKIQDEQPQPPVAGVTETGETVTPAQAVGKLQDMVDSAKEGEQPQASANLPVEPATPEQVKEKMDAEIAKADESKKADSVS